MAHDEHEHPNPNRQDDPSTTPLLMGGIVGSLLTIVTIVATAALYYHNDKRFTKAIVYDNPARPSVEALKDAQRVNLTADLRWADRSKGTITRIGIDQAIQLTAAEGGRWKAPLPASAPASAPAASETRKLPAANN